MRKTSVAMTCILLATFGWGQKVNTPPDTLNHYKFRNVGGLGYPFSTFFSSDIAGFFTPSALNGKGDLAAIYLSKSNLAGSFVWSNGKSKGLPSLPNANRGGGGSNALGITNGGLVIGISNDGEVSPFNNKLYNHAVSWKYGKLRNLGDLGGHDSNANSVNNSGLIVGLAFNATPDPYGYYGTQLHATTWRNGKITDLGTLGGTDSEARLVNDSGQIIGISFLNTPPMPPFNQPQDDAFLWSAGTMTDLGTLGGSFSAPSSINRSGQVSVISLDATNSVYQSFLWSNGTKTVLNSLGGSYVFALMLNDAATVVGWNSDAADNNVIATMWSPSGNGQSLGTIGTDTGSIAFGINNKGTIVGGSGVISLTTQTSYVHAFVWKNGQMLDLNTLIPAGSSLTLNVAYTINNAGIIAGLGTDKKGQTHPFVLEPDASNPGSFRSAASAPAAPGSSIRVPSPLQQTLPKALALRESR